MKKQWLILLGCFLLAMVMCLTVSWPETQHESTVPSVSTRPATGSTSGTDGQDPGEVRLYLCHWEDREAFEDLAQQFTELTGVPCRILTGDLAVLMASDTKPTIFGIHSREEAEQWEGSMLDLSGSPVLEQLYADAFALYMDEKPVSLAMDVTGYGLIYNASLLAQAGYTRTDITDYSSLRAVVEYITMDYSVLGFQAFGAADAGNNALAAYLAGISKDPAQIREFFDLYRNNAIHGGDSLARFAEGQTVFYVGGIWEYDGIADLGSHNLDIMPLYTAVGGSFHCVCDTYWSINAQVSQADIQASLDFVNWMVTAREDGSVAVDSLGWLAPFADATGSDNALERLFRKYIATEAVTVRWSVSENMTEQALSQLAAAIAAYAVEGSDEAWAAVEALLKN